MNSLYNQVYKVQGQEWGSKTMKVTALEEYGLRCILQLAQADRNRPLSCTEIARGERISVPYAAKLLNILKHSGLVKTSTGAKGGYQISRDPDKITVLEVLKALDGSLFVSDFVEFCKCFAGLQEECVHYRGSCSIRSVWTTIAGHVAQALGKLTLGDLVTNREPAMMTLLGSRFAEDVARRGWTGLHPS